MEPFVPWTYRIQEGLGGTEFKSKDVTLKPGVAPPERIILGKRGFIIREVGIQENVGIAIYECIMEVT